MLEWSRLFHWESGSPRVTRVTRVAQSKSAYETRWEMGGFPERRQGCLTELTILRHAWVHWWWPREHRMRVRLHAGRCSRTRHVLWSARSRPSHQTYTLRQQGTLFRVYKIKDKTEQCVIPNVHLFYNLVNLFMCYGVHIMLYFNSPLTAYSLCKWFQQLIYFLYLLFLVTYFNPIFKQLFLSYPIFISVL